MTPEEFIHRGQAAQQAVNDLGAGPRTEITVPSTNRPQDYMLLDLSGFVWMLSADGQWVEATVPEMHKAQEVLSKWIRGR